MPAFRARRAPAKLFSGLGGALAVLFALPPATAYAQCLPDPPMAGDTVTCSGVLNFGFTVPTGINNVTVLVDPGTTITTIGDGVLVNNASTVENRGTLTVNGVGSSAVEAGTGGTADRTVVTNALGGTIIANADQTMGMSAQSRVDATNDGTIQVNGLRASGIQLGNGAANARSTLSNSATGVITVDGAEAVGLVANTNVDILQAGTIMGTGADAFGIRTAGNTVTTQTGMVMLSGDASTGVEVGQSGSLINSGIIAAQGTNGVGVSVETSADATNFGTIRVEGTDAVGIVANAFNPIGPDANVLNGRDPATGATGTILSTNPNAGPLIRLATGSQPFNRVRNDPGAVLRADLTNLGVTGRAIAIEGSDGSDQVDNAGSIEGRIQLGAGDDDYAQQPSGSFVDIGPGQIDGGAGMDEALLGKDTPDLGSFAPDVLQNFEALRIFGLWRLTTQSPAGLPVQVDPGGTLRVDSALRIEGDLTVLPTDPTGPAGILEAQIDAGTSALPELVSVGGTATITDGALAVLVDNRFTGSATVTVLRADTALVGQFASASVPNDPGLVISQPIYDAAANTVSLSVLALPFTANQAATSSYLDRLEASGPAPALQTIIDGINGLEYAGYRQALDQLHPEAYDAHTATTLELAHQYTQLMLDRPRYCVAGRDERRRDPRTQLPCRERRLEAWAALYGQLGNRTGSVGHISYDDRGAGFVLGLDHRVNERVLLSGTIGTAYDSIQVLGIGKGRLKTLDLGFYAGYTHGSVRVQGVATYGHGWQTRFRNIRLPGFARTSTGDWGTNRVGALLQTEYLLPLGGWNVVPLASIDYTAMLQDAFVETGAQPTSLVVDARTDNLVTLRVGVDLATAVHKQDYWTELLEFADGVWRPSLSVKWRQVLTGADRPITAGFVGDPLGAAGKFTVTGQAPDKGFEVGAGIDWTPRRTNRLTVGVRYDVFVWTDVTSHDLVARVRLGF